MNSTWQVLAAVLSPVACGAATMLLPRRAIGSRVALALLGPVAALAILGWFLQQHGLGTVTPTVAWMPAVQLNVSFNADALGMFFALLVAGIGLLITLYARAYFGPDADSLYRFYPSLHLFMTAMLGVALSDHLLLLLLFWELTSISSFLLIGWERDQPGAVRNAMQAFIVTGIGGLALMAGLIVLGVHTDLWTFSALKAAVGNLQASALLTAAFVLIFAGAAAKSAQFPLHFWLPGAMAAPTPVSAYLHSATMVKAGVYLTGRLWPILAVSLPLWPQLIIPLGALTMVYGAFIALQKQDLKQIFAYTTVSQLGLLMCMYGLAAFEYPGHGAGHAMEPNLIWDVTQILNHAMYKAPLFILAGAIGHIASRQLHELRGLLYRGGTERIMTIVLLLAGYALAAGPFTVSFTAKEMFFYQIYHALKTTESPWMWGLVAAGVATGMFNVAIFVRLVSVLCAKPQAGHGHEGHGHHHAAHGHGHGHGDHGHETGLWPAFLWIPGLVIVVFQYVGGIVPGAFERLFGWLEASPHYFAHFPMTWDAHPGMPLYMSLTAIALGIGLGVAPLLRGIYNDPFDHVYPGFYTGVTKIVGPRAFGLIQNGHAGWYVAAVSATLVFLFVWAVRSTGLQLQWPEGASVELTRRMVPGVLVTTLICLAAILLPIVKDRASRVLVLGVCGFSVTIMYYLYQAPDLALTQLSIEIVSLILFLLVLSLLPRTAEYKRIHALPRLVLAGAVGAVMFWLTLTSSLATKPAMPYRNIEGRSYAHLGEYFLRNSYKGVDTAHAPASELRGGVEPRTPPASYGNATHDSHEGEVTIHKGGGGGNVVNVILVDFRGFDTMGEITVLGLAALGVWMLLRRTPAQPGEPYTAGDGEGLGDHSHDEHGHGHEPRNSHPHRAGQAAPARSSHP
jgi:NADH:ubiquinone oxidoreductase subunit 5 (subunit L)/multisubunit Na+/H+ antiporter MnhA subunit